MRFYVVFTLGLAVVWSAAPCAASGKAPASGKAAAEYPASTSPWGKAKRIYVVPLRGQTNDINYYSLRTRFRKAAAAGADLILLDIHSPGGPISSSIRIAKLIGQQRKPPVVAYVEQWALSGGSMAALACPTIIMNAHAHLGDSQAVMIRPRADKPMVPAPEKVSTAVRAAFRTFAQQNGYPVALLEAMVNPEIEVTRLDMKGCGPIYVSAREKGNVLRKTLGSLTLREEPEGDKTLLVLKAVGSVRVKTAEKRKLLGTLVAELVEDQEVVVHKGKLLTLTATEALDFGIAKKVVKDRAEAVALLSTAGAKVEEIEPSKTETLVGWLNSAPVIGLLMLVGLGSLYMALKMPGFGFPEMLAIVCFSLFFMGQYLVGKADVHVEVMLFAVGIGLIALEIFVIPGFGVVGVAGALLVFVSLILSLQDFALPQADFQWRITTRNAAIVTGAMVLATVLFFAVLRVSPHAPFLKRLTLTAANSAEDGYVAATHDLRYLVGKQGVAISMLRPAGRVEVEGKALQALTQGEFIEKDELVEICRVDGNRIVVRRA